jgi:hypothetical protein
LDRQFNVLNKEAGGDGEKRAIPNIKFGVNFHKKNKIHKTAF